MSKMKIHKSTCVCVCARAVGKCPSSCCVWFEVYQMKTKKLYRQEEHLCRQRPDAVRYTHTSLFFLWSHKPVLNTDFCSLSHWHL